MYQTQSPSSIPCFSDVFGLFHCYNPEYNTQLVNESLTSANIFELFFKLLFLNGIFLQRIWPKPVITGRSFFAECNNHRHGYDEANRKPKRTIGKIALAQ